MTFEKIVATQNSKLIVSVWGLEKVGKTHFALTFPEPIYFFNFDLGIEELLPKFKAKEIFVSTYAPNTIDLIPYEEAKRLFDQFCIDYQEALSRNEGTIVIDTGTQLWQLVQKIMLENIKKKRESKGQQIYAFDYADANVVFQNILNAVKKTDMNLVIIHRAREIYNAQGNRTGRFESHENNAVSYLVQLVIRLERSENGRNGVIESCRFDPELENNSIPNITFEDLRKLFLA
jgi:hypothetical protein